jgi:hypothetical protein
MIDILIKFKKFIEYFISTESNYDSKEIAKTEQCDCKIKEFQYCLRFL